MLANIIGSVYEKGSEFQSQLESALSHKILSQRHCQWRAAKECPMLYLQ